MPPIQLLIKPASGSCNLRCKYCFYEDEMSRRSTANYGIMSFKTLEAVVEKSLAYADRSCGFTFQGGEPTLAGLEFFRELIRLEEKHNRKGVQISNAIQTNGLGRFFCGKPFSRGYFPGRQQIHPRRLPGGAGRKGDLRGGDEDRRLI